MAQIRQKASRDFLCHGYLEKTPPLQSVRAKQNRYSSQGLILHSAEMAEAFLCP